MKLLLTAFASFALVSAAFASEPKIEMGTLYTKNGTRIACVYSTDGGHTQEVDMIFPGWAKIQVTMERLNPNSRRIERSNDQVEYLKAIAERELSK